jgi:hypothetical protein
MDTTEVLQNTIKYSCVHCNYNTQRNSQYERHLLTSKHLERSKEDNKVPDHICDCGKIYNTRQGLWKHKKNCSHQMKEEKMSMIIEQNNKILQEIDKTRSQINTLTSSFMYYLRLQNDVRNFTINT